MALSRVKTWVAGEELTYSDLNNEINNIIDNGPALVTPFTGSVDLDGNSLILDADGDTSIDSATDDTIDVTIAGADDFRFTANKFEILTGSQIDMNGTTTILDADADTTLDAATDDTVVLTLGVGGTATVITSDARTDSVDVPFIVASTTSGTPAAGIGTAIILRSESADESPSDFGQLGFIADDIASGSEDTRLSVWTRVGGGALARVYDFVATTAPAFRAIFTHNNSDDRTYTLPNASGTFIISGQGSVGTSEAKTSTGSSNGTLNTGTAAAITMNDYSFFPNAQQTDGGTHISFYTNPNADSGTTVSRFSLLNTDGGSSHTYHVRWRYFTASDMPEMWIIADPGTGQILHAWAADDPLPNGLPGITMSGYTPMRVTATDLEPLSVLSAKASEAQALIRDRKLRAQHQAYRALQLLANDDAPSSWLLNNCTVSKGKLIHVA